MSLSPLGCLPAGRVTGWSPSALMDQSDRRSRTATRLEPFLSAHLTFTHRLASPSHPFLFQPIRHHLQDSDRQRGRGGEGGGGVSAHLPGYLLQTGLHPGGEQREPPASTHRPAYRPSGPSQPNSPPPPGAEQQVTLTHSNSFLYVVHTITKM